MQLKPILFVAASLLVVATAIPHPGGTQRALSREGSTGIATNKGSSGATLFSAEIVDIFDRRAHGEAAVSTIKDEKDRDIPVDAPVMGNIHVPMMDEEESHDARQFTSPRANAVHPRAAKPPHIGVNNAPDPRLACTICSNQVSRCDKDCKGEKACAIYCRCKLKQTDVNCMVCNTWQEQCEYA